MGILIWRADFSRLMVAISDIDPIWLAGAFLIQIVGKLIWAWRWTVLLEIFDISVPYWHLVKGIYVGLFFGNFLPTGVGGDLYRGYWILNEKALYARSMFIIFIERFIGVVSLAYIALPPFLLLLTHELVSWDASLFLLPVLIGMCGGFLLLHPAVFDFWNEFLFHSNDRWLAGMRKKVSEALHLLHQAGERRWHITFLSLVLHLVGIAFFYFLGRSLGLELAAWHYLVIVPLTVVATLLPISLNGLGVREGTLVLLIGILSNDVDSSEAIALGLLASVVGMLISLVGASFYIAGNNKEAYAA